MRRAEDLLVELPVYVVVALLLVRLVCSVQSSMVVIVPTSIVNCHALSTLAVL
jgi:hypothetical protein